MLVEISIGSRVSDTKLQTKQLKIKQLFKLLSKPEIRQKKDGAYFVFATFNKKQRSAVNIQQYNGATIDVDHSTLSIEELKQSFRKYRHCIYTTHSHRRTIKDPKTGERIYKGDRYRIVIPYKEPLTSDRHKLATAYLMSLLPVEDVDYSSGDLSRPMYLPACPEKKLKDFKFKENKVKKRFKLTSTMEFKANELLEIDNSEFKEKFDADEETHTGSRNSELSRFAGQLINKGKSLKEAIREVQGYNVTSVKPPLHKSEVKTIVTSIFSTHKKNHKDGAWGFAELMRLIEEEKPKQTKENFEAHLKRIAKSRDKLSKTDFIMLFSLLQDKTRFGKKTIKEVYASITGETKDEEKKDEADKQELTLEQIKEKFSEYTYVSNDDRVYSNKKDLTLKREAFNVTYAGTFEKGVLINQLVEYNLVKQADRKEYHPGNPIHYRREGLSLVNTYRAVKRKAVKGNVTPFLNHVAYLLPDEKEQEILLQWMAYLFQNPGKKISWMLILKGNRRTGKSMLEEFVLRPLLGSRNVKQPESKIVKSDFNSWILDAQLQVFHELRLGTTKDERVHLTDSLRSAITESTIQAHKKGVDPYPVINVVNMLAFTNFDDALMIAKDEGRFCFLRSPPVKKERVYYARLRKWFRKKETKRALLHYFQNKDLSTFDRSIAPETVYTNEIKDNSLMWPASTLNEALNDPHHIFNTDGAIPWDTIVEYVSSESTGRDAIIAENLRKESGTQGHRLVQALGVMGFKKYHLKGVSGNTRMRINSRLQSVWIAPDHIDKYQNYTAKQIRKVFKGQRTVFDF